MASTCTVQSLSADAAEFVPGQTWDRAEDDVAATLPPMHRRLLRGTFYDPLAGVLSQYYVGRLKSYRNASGFGFIECKQSHDTFGTDVFVHKKEMSQPWRIGQVCEFAINVNARGQAQATDVMWLPMQRGQKHGSLFDGSGYLAKSPATTTNVPPSATEVSPSASQDARHPVVSNQPRRLGVIKSFSPQSGYGFVNCEETFEYYTRDVYIAQNQLPANIGNVVDRFVEFDVQLNSGGQPQARNVDLDPMSMSLEPGAVKNVPHPEIVKKLKLLLLLLHRGDSNQAILDAVSPGDKSAALNVDYVSYVLKRIRVDHGGKEEAVSQLKDFTKMILALKLGALLSQRQIDATTLFHVEWLECTLNGIEDLASGEMLRNFGTVSERIKAYLDACVRAAGPQLFDYAGLHDAMSNAQAALDQKIDQHAAAASV
eukprot:TRINITY_DN32726_c0_g2_i1.p1 TRINITY_DN32726_c0_g2~~TRINITY_DN32726_c0_g2_i1.p1  ORF type:complete len:428 (-),score=89.81 TRINITY_DN32726_c0_g2_i1:53-1336(-)